MDTLFITRTDLRRIVGILCLFVVLCTLTVGFILSCADKEHSKRLDELERCDVDYDTPPQTTEVRRPVYIAAVYADSSIAIFSAHDGSLVRIIDIAVRSLPETDIRLLHSGIPLYSDDELCGLIADYTG